jgi:hypothetical protein
MIVFRVLVRGFVGVLIVAFSVFLIDPFDYTDETNESPTEVWREIFAEGWWR